MGDDLQQLAAGFGLIRPDFDAVPGFCRGSRRPGGAFADSVADVAPDEVDTFPVLHDTRSYWGFQPRPIPRLRRQEAV
jgi:hypothetical protein